GVALIDLGELNAATDTLREAEREAKASADERLQTHAGLMRLLAEMYQEPEGKTEVAYAEGTRAIPIFERYGDEQGLARAGRLVADCHALKGRIGDLQEAAPRVQEHAARAEGGQLHAAGIAYWVGAIALGPRPVEEGIALLVE